MPRKYKNGGVTPVAALLAAQPIAFVAIDEAHCISSWGHDFRPEYRGLGCLRQRFPGATLHAFTATATDRVRADIVTQLGLLNPTILIGNFHRKNLIYQLQRRESGLDQICGVMERFRDQAGIVYAITRAKVEQISELLNRMGFRTLPYHAGLTDVQRIKNQDALVNDEIEAIVATVAFGMGIDKSNVRYVIHAEMPKSIENYQQESGRAGRDGLASECWLFYSSQDFMTWKRIIDQSPPDSQASALTALQKIYDFCGSVVCRHKQLVGHFGQEFNHECHECDVCLGKLETAAEPLIIGQKILSCVLRCRENFGADHIAKVLTGSREEKIVKFSHDRLSTWGLMKEHPRGQIRDWIDQLLGQHFLEKVGEYALLKVTPEGRLLLRGERTPTLLQPVRRTATETTEPLADFWEGVDRGLFGQLRELRRQLADKAGVPAYIIFSDATLRDLAYRRPVNPDVLLQIHGIGQRKSQDFGAAVMGLIERYCREHQVATNVAAAVGSRQRDPLKSVRASNLSALQAFEFFDRGLSIAEVCQQMNRAASTVCGYLEEYIRAQGITDVTRWVDPADVPAVEAAAQGNDTGRLKPIFEALHGRVSYDSIRIILSCQKNRAG